MTENILLVEPDYKNKFPPIGLMKISTYHKNRGDHVEFFKGFAPYDKIIDADRIYITSLFTFYFDKTVETVNYYRQFYPDSRIYFGGIAATIMPERFREKLGKVNIQEGQRRSSSELGYDDDVDIDTLPLDYDILDDVDYDYPAADNFFAYSTRGCSRKCPFCAVRILEPEFRETNDLVRQIETSRKIYGDHRNILLMDNNVLCSENLKKLVSDLNGLGFLNNTKNYVRPNFFDIAMAKIDRRRRTGNSVSLVIRNLISDLERMNISVMTADIGRTLRDDLTQIACCRNDRDRISVLEDDREILHEAVSRYIRHSPLQRYVDFNQGIDARYINDENMSILSGLPLNPFRLAYDHPEMADTYEAAFRTAYRHGVRSFSNYMLYNYNDGPEDLWARMNHNVRLHTELPDVHLFSFPMKYAPIDETDRKHVGPKWSKKQLAAMNVILNVTKGVVMPEDDFFHRAYGNSPEEFLRILAMPSEFIKYRAFFEDNGLADQWRNEYDYLTPEEKDRLLEFLDGRTTSEDIEGFSSIMKYYHMTKTGCSGNLSR